jgi:hypothetical protein
MADPLFDYPPPYEGYVDEDCGCGTDGGSGPAKNYTRRCDECVSVNDFAWTPHQLRQSDTVSALDSGRAERITFLRTCNETLTAIDRPRKLSLRVGETKKGWVPEMVQKLVYWDLEPNSRAIFIVEDQLEFRTLSEGRLRIHNPEANKVWAMVEEYVLVDGVWRVGVLVNDQILGHGLIDVDIPNPLTLPQKPVVSPMRLVYRKVTLINQELTVNSLVTALISGWSARSTTLPVAFPGV